MEFREEILTDGNLAVHCTTEEQAKNLLEWANKNGLTWCDGDSYLSTNCWDINEEKTCYCIAAGHYADLNYYVEDYKIISYEEALEMEK